MDDIIIVEKILDALSALSGSINERKLKVNVQKIKPLVVTGTLKGGEIEAYIKIIEKSYT